MSRSPILVLALSLSLSGSVLGQVFPITLPILRAHQHETQEPEEGPSRKQLNQWVADLRGGTSLQRENAVRQLIAAGEKGASAVRRLCSAMDRAVADRALLVFGSVHGVDPDTMGEVREAIASTQGQGRSTAAAAAEILEMGEAAVAHARRVLAPDDGDSPSALYAELTVRSAVPAITASADYGGALREEVLALSVAAAGPLFRMAEDHGIDCSERLNALWLYGVIGAPGRATHLARMLGDRDATFRGEALTLLQDALRAADFDAVASAVRRFEGAAHQAVAQAAARVVPADSLVDSLRGGDEGQRLVAALALGSIGGETVQKALTRALENDGESAVVAAAARALAVYPGEEVTTALVDAFAKTDSVEVRTAVIGALRHRQDDANARFGVCAALFDVDASVRLLAAEALSASEQKCVAPALILAASRDDSRSLRARVDSTLDRMFPNAVSSQGGSIQPWVNWLRRQGDDEHEEALPWYRASREAAGLVRGVSRRIRSEFFHFGKTELIDEEKLDAVARKAMTEAISSLETDGSARTLLRRIVENENLTEPDQVLEALGSIPFASSASDMVRLTNAAAGAMVKHLDDPYSRLTASNDAEGETRPEWLPGILEDDENNGFMVKKKGDKFVVDFVLYDSPAWWAGIERGDQLIKVGDELISELKPKDLRKRLRKKDEFSLLREGWARPYAFELTPSKSHHRRMVTSTMLPGGIGYIRLKMFELGCSSAIETALAELERDGLKALVLDLRSNPGGTVADATAICDLFLPEGKVITINETRDGEDETTEQTVKSSNKGEGRTWPIAVLVNECSASASEMTSGSLQGNDRAVVVGQTSFGKGIGQSGASFPGFSSDTPLGRTRSQYVLSLTMMRYYVPPERRSIHGTGVQPDLAVRERRLKGSSFDKVMRATGHKAFVAYVNKLQEDHAELCVELCRFDDGAPDKYPEFDKLATKLERYVEADDLRKLVRSALRVSFLQDAEDERYSDLCCDLQGDRTLRAALNELCNKAEIDRGQVPEYTDLR